MRIVHLPGRKMWCAYALSRRRQAEEDDQTQFEVEQGELAKVELQPGVERVSLCQNSDRKFYMRIVEGACVRKAAVESVCHSAAVFSTSSAVPEDLQRYSQEWSAFYEKDPEFQEIWRRGAQEDWGHTHTNRSCTSPSERTTEKLCNKYFGAIFFPQKITCTDLQASVPMRWRARVTRAF